MIIETTCYDLKCDICGKTYFADESCGYSDKEAVIEEAEADGMWLINHEGKDICPNCYWYDDDDKLMIKELKN